MLDGGPAAAIPEKIHGEIRGNHHKTWENHWTPTYKMWVYSWEIHRTIAEGFSIHETDYRRVYCNVVYPIKDPPLYHK